MTKITLTRLTKLAAEKGARDAQARIAELEAALADLQREYAEYQNETHTRDDDFFRMIDVEKTRAERAEAKLREIITDATSREHALTIAREGLE